MQLGIERLEQLGRGERVPIGGTGDEVAEIGHGGWDRWTGIGWKTQLIRRPEGQQGAFHYSLDRRSLRKTDTVLGGSADTRLGGSEDGRLGGSADGGLQPSV